MLDEYKELYTKSANRIPDWKKLNKNTLCNLYIEHENDPLLAESYFSAIICKYWKMIDKFLSISYNVTDEETVYEWLVDSVLYALKHRSWLRPNSSIYNDPNGPDKVINRCMKCRRFTYYQAINRKKRKGGFGALSIEMLNEQSNACSPLLKDFKSEREEFHVYLSDMINRLYSAKNYEAAYVMDIIAYGDVMSKIKGEPSQLCTRKLIRELRNIDEEYLREFAFKYSLNYDKIVRDWKHTERGRGKGTFRNFLFCLFHELQETEFFNALRGGR